MPDRILRDELLNSDRFLALKRNTHRLAFVCLLLTCDSLGNLEATDGQLWRLWREPLALQERVVIPEILGALVDVDLIRVYEADGKRYIHVPRTRFRLRFLTRICPLSPWTTEEQKQRLKINSPDCRPTIDGLESAKEVKEGVKKYKDKPRASRESASFLRFWSAYPKKRAKPEALKAWLKLNPDDDLVADILRLLAGQIDSEEWIRERGKFIPYPATWINGRRWEDEAMEVPSWKSKKVVI